MTALARFDAALARGDNAFAALHALAEDSVGVRLFSVTMIDHRAGEARRVYTSDPENYPLSGTKPLVLNGFLSRMLAGQTYWAASPEAMQDDFPDLETIRRLGCGSVVNLPVMLAGALRATVNLLDAPGHFDAITAEWTAAVLSLPAKAAVLAYRPG